MYRDHGELLIADAWMLLTLTHPCRQHLLAALPYRVLLADVVRAQIRKRYGSRQVEEAVDQKRIRVVSLSGPADLRAVMMLRDDGLSTGEAISLIAAQHLQALLATDDPRVTK